MTTKVLVDYYCVIFNKSTEKFLSSNMKMKQRKIDELSKNIEEIAYKSEIIRQNLTILDA